jgi:hypothetical protein
MSAYRPRGDSLAARVCNFFVANPDEELSLDDIAGKFAVTRSIIHTLLAQCIAAGLLARSDSSDEWVYRAGKKLAPGVAPEKAGPHAPAKGTLEAAFRPARAPQTFIAVDPTAVRLDDEVPVPVLRVTVATDWTLLLKRMRPGQSAVLPAPKRAAVSRACNLEKKAGRGKFLMQETQDKSQFRVWRTE